MPNPEGPIRAWKISVISFFILTLELALIRQMPAEVRAISYFTNLLLMASFFGLGLGCILQRARTLTWFVPVGLALIAGFIYFARGIVVYDEAASVHFWIDVDSLRSSGLRLPMSVSAVLAFALSAVPFVGLGQILARTMDVHPRLNAYGWDIGGSLAGSIAFSVGALLQLPPWGWTALGALVFAPVGFRHWLPRALCVASGALFLIFSHSPYPSHWSPYYLVQHDVNDSGVQVFVNSSFHQHGLNFRSKDPTHAGTAALAFKRFSVPYREYQRHHGGQAPRRVLILGAGTGNDVVVALKNGAEQITAVEIDPVIAELGRRHNTSRPYQSPKVRLVLDDARHFLWNCQEKFDLVIFGTLDSQTLLSGHSHIRLENYVYTEESFQDVRRVLAPRGMFVAYYSIFKLWLIPRLLATASAAFPGRIKQVAFNKSVLFNYLIMGSADIEELKGDAQQEKLARSGIPATDDWPYLYLRSPTIGPLYLTVMAALVGLIFGAFMLLRSQHRVTGLHTNFFLLGVGFTLMETAAVVRFALLFGATWVTNSLVFIAVLSTILVANWLTQKELTPRLSRAWGGLFLFVLLNYFMPMQELFALGAGARVLALACLIGAPVFFAAVCFSRLFRVQPLTGSALGMNLVGAMAGGLVEYISMVTGMRAVWLLVLAVYLGAMLTSRLSSTETAPKG